MEFMDKITNALTEKGHAAVDKAKILAEIARLKGQIATCEDIIRKNYLEIGKKVFEAYEEEQEECSLEDMTSVSEAQRTFSYEKQCKAIANARIAIDELKKQVKALKGK